MWRKYQKEWGLTLSDTQLVLVLAPIVAGVAMILGWLALRMVGVGTPAAIKAMNRALHAHGYIEDMGWFARLEQRFSVVRQLTQLLDMERLLAIADVPDTAMGYLGKTIGLGLGVLGGGLLLDGMGFIVQGSWFVSPVLVLVVAGVLMGLRIEKVRRTAAQRGVVLDRSIRAILPLMAAALSVPGNSTAGTLRSLAACIDHPELMRLLNNDRWRRVLPDIPLRASDMEVFEAIGQAYGSRLFDRLAKTLGNRDTSGVNEGKAISQVTKVSFEEELDDINEIVAKAPTRAMIVVAGLVMLLVSIILIPMLGSFAQL